MLAYVASAFRSGVNAILWIILIGCTVIGGIVGFEENEFIYRVGGILGGGLIGLIICIFFGGIIANFLIMVDNIEKIAKAQNEMVDNIKKITKTQNENVPKTLENNISK